MSVLEGKWLGYCYGHTARAARYTNEYEATEYFGYVLDQSIRIVNSITGWFSPEVQEYAFGRLGESGRPAVIEYNARSLCTLLGEWLDFALELRSVTVPSRLLKMQELALELNSEPIRTTHSFVESIITQMEAIPRILAERVEERPIRIELTLTLIVSDKALSACKKEIARLRGRR